MASTTWYRQWPTQKKIHVVQGLSGLLGAPGEDPPDSGEFLKICKKCVRKIIKNELFSRIFELI